jgi:hypothetical protein
MRINIEVGEHIVASLPKVWGNELGVMGFFSKSREGILHLTDKKLIFVPRYTHLTQKEMDKFYGGDQAKLAKIDGYSETQLDEDIEGTSKSLVIPLSSISSVESVTLRKINFLRVKYKTGNRSKGYDFGITKSVTNYPLRQPLLFYSIDWEPWVRAIKAYL